jgi:DNA-binding GntR family transcriptional regulator
MGGSMELELPALNHADLTEQTYQVLKEKILRRQLQPDEKISVDDVAEGLGVSRTPVVNALQQLANDGLVRIVPRRGTFVTELSAQDVAELFDVRLMIELYAARSVLREGIVTEFLGRVDEAVMRMDQAMDGDDYRDYEAFISGDRDLHRILIEMTDNAHLVRIYGGLNVHMGVARTHYLNTVQNARQAQEEHKAILRAFRAGEWDAIKEALTAHIEEVRTRILEILEEHDGKL